MSMNIKIKYPFKCNVALFVITSLLVFDGLALTVTNKDENQREMGIKFFSLNSSATDFTDSKTCKHFKEKELGHAPAIQYNDQLILATNNTSSTSSRHVCVYVDRAGFNFMPNPLADVPECEIQIFWVQSSNGYARATPQCQYTGKCADGQPYAGTRAACLPT